MKIYVVCLEIASQCTWFQLPCQVGEFQWSFKVSKWPNIRPNAAARSVGWAEAFRISWRASRSMLFFKHVERDFDLFSFGLCEPKLVRSHCSMTIICNACKRCTRLPPLVIFGNRRDVQSKHPIRMSRHEDLMWTTHLQTMWFLFTFRIIFRSKMVVITRKCGDVSFLSRLGFRDIITRNDS
jgi:hypothetical protein